MRWSMFCMWIKAFVKSDYHICSDKCLLSWSSPGIITKLYSLRVTFYAKSFTPQLLKGQIFHTQAFCKDKITYFSIFLTVDGSSASVSVLATKEMLFLLDEDHQWSKSQPEGQMSSGKVTIQETQPISCVSSIHLFSSEPCQMDLKLYDEVCGYIFTCSQLNHRETKSNCLNVTCDYYMGRINLGFSCLFLTDGQERKDMVFTCWRCRAGTRPGQLDHKSVGKHVWGQTDYYQAVTTSHNVKEKHLPYFMKIPA